MGSKRDQAVEMLQHYLKMIYDKAGGENWSSDCYTEIEAIVDLILDEAVERACSMSDEERRTRYGR